MTPKFRHLSTKTYCHNIGLSCAFRQWRADSHCKYIHGYALEVKLTFGCTTLDETNWVMDFGGLKEVKAFLEDQFDHKLIVALDDPEKAYLEDMHIRGLADIKYLPEVGCEAFAEYIYTWVDAWMVGMDKTRLPILQNPRRVFLKSVEVKEHGSNSAIYERIE